MIRFTLRSLLKNKFLWAWPGLFLLFSIVVFIWGDISSAQNSYSFIINIGGGTLPTNFFVQNLLVSFTVLVAIIGLPTHFSENLKPARAALILSKPISRTEYFFYDFAAVLAFSFIYTLISLFFLALLVIFKAFIFPYQFFIGMLLLLPLLIFTYYVTITFFLTLTNSYLGGVIVGYFLTSLSSVFLNSDPFLQMFGLSDTFFASAIAFFSYIIPSAGGVEQLIRSVLSNGFSSLDGSLFLFVLITCLPFGALGYFVFIRKEF